MLQSGSSIVRKLDARGALVDHQIESAALMLAGLLKWLWDSLNVVSVEKKRVEGQCAVAQLAVASFNEHWNRSGTLTLLLGEYPSSITATLEATTGLSYDKELYPAIEAAIASARERGLALLAAVAERYPDRVPDTITFLLRSLVKVNVYSYLDGSVPECICDRLNALYTDFAGRAEDCLMPWLMKGFQSARDAPMDALDRWCYGLAAEAPATA